MNLEELEQERIDASIELEKSKVALDIDNIRKYIDKIEKRISKVAFNF